MAGKDRVEIKGSSLFLLSDLSQHGPGAQDQEGGYPLVFVAPVLRLELELRVVTEGQ